MTEPVGGLFVRIGADFSELVGGFEKADKAVVKFTKAVDRHAREWAKIGAAAGVGAAAVFMFTKRATDALDALGKMSQRVGVSVESLSALKHAASLADVSMEQLGIGLKQLSKNMADMQAGTGDAQLAFKAMGLSVTDSQGRLKGTEAMLTEVAGKFSKMEDGAGKTALAMRIFGKSGADLIPLLNQGKEGLEAARKEAERLGIVFSTQAAKQAEEFNDNLTRLQNAAEGLQIKLAGPLVEALGKASKAMLEANASGETLFRTLIEGFRTLVTGDDLHKWNVEMAEAGEALLKAQNKLDQARNVQRAPGQSEFGGRLVKQAQDEVAQAMAEIERLRSIQPILAPEVAAAAGGGPKAAAPGLAKADPEAEAAAKADQRIREEAFMEAYEEEENRENELADLNREYNDDQLEQEKEFQRQRLQIIFDTIDAEQEAAIEAGAEELRISKEIDDEEKRRRERELSARQTFLQNLAGMMNTNSKKMFEIGKAASLAQAGYKGALAVLDAWEAGMSVGGPWAPLVAAAYAAAAGANALNLMNNIRKQQFGGGGGAPVAPTQGSSGVSPVGAGGAGPAQRGPDTIINLRGEDMFSGRTLAKLAERLNEFSRDGGRVLVSAS